MLSKLSKRIDWRIDWRRVLIGLGVLALLAAVLGLVAWNKLFREQPQPAWVTADPRNNFLYGSVGAESSAGIPYWIWLVLPRVFPEYLPGPGGYASVGLPWEQGKEMPAGFTKRTIGFPRVGNNCALCHAASYRTKEDEAPTVVPAGPGHTQDVQALIEFFAKAAGDPRFNADDLLAEIDLATDLSFLDKLLYRYAFIPCVREALLAQGKEFEWTRVRPLWGPGRDDPMNLTKYPFLDMRPIDDTVGNADMPSIWNLKTRERPAPLGTVMALNWDGATPVPRSVIIDSALGLHGDNRHPNTPFFQRRMQEMEAYLKELPAPRYPLPVDAALAAAGRPVFAAHCASCHAVENAGRRMGTVIPIAEIATDRNRLDTWTQAAADLANETVASLGIDRKPMTKTDGYVAVPLDGIWLRGPYLHNGSVPTVRALLDPPEQRPAVFYRGYDVLDPADVGFVSTGPKGWRFDTRERGNGNGGHLYGVALAPADKDALLEYLKTI